MNDSTGAIDFQFDPSNPDIMYVAFWQAGRTPWSMSSGGGQWAVQEHRCRAHVDQPHEDRKGAAAGDLGKIGIAVSPAKPSRIWALVEHDSGGVYRSDDGGASWQFINGERKLRQRAWYYSTSTPTHATRTWCTRSTSASSARVTAKTFPQTISVPHEDSHDLWIAPNDPSA